MCRGLQFASRDTVLELATVVGLKEGHIRAKVGDRAGVRIARYKVYFVARGEVQLEESKNRSVAF